MANEGHEEHVGVYSAYVQSVLHLRTEYRKAYVHFRREHPNPEKRGTREEERVKQEDGSRLDAMMLAAMLTTAGAVECLANYYLAQKLDPWIFSLVERKKLMDKWTICIENILPGYRLPLDGGPGQRLKRLVTVRNEFAHAKSGIKRDGKQIHQAMRHHTISFDELEAWTSLPWDLVSNLLKHDKGMATLVMIAVMPDRVSPQPSAPPPADPSATRSPAPTPPRPS